MAKLISYDFLVYNIKSGVFFTATFKGDRYATAHTKAEKKLPSNIYFIVCEAPKMQDMKNCVNSWVADCGQFIPCGYMGHNRLASEFLEGIGKLDDGDGYPYEELHKMGWLRMLNWGNDVNKTKVYFNDLKTMPNSTQKETLLTWCALNGVEYNDLFTNR